MRRKLITALVAFAVVAGGSCAEKENKKGDQPSCVTLKLKSDAPDAKAKQEDCKS